MIVFFVSAKKLRWINLVFLKLLLLLGWLWPMNIRANDTHNINLYTVHTYVILFVIVSMWIFLHTQSQFCAYVLHFALYHNIYICVKILCIYGFKAAFEESSRQPVKRPIKIQNFIYAHIWKRVKVHSGGESWIWGNRRIYVFYIRVNFTSMYLLSFLQCIMFIS